MEWAGLNDEEVIQSKKKHGSNKIESKMKTNS